MPAKSQAQARKIAVLYKQGKVSKKVLNDFDKGISYKSLPKRVKRKKM